MRVPAFATLNRHRTCNHVERLCAVFCECTVKTAVDDRHGIKTLGIIFGLREDVQYLREVLFPALPNKAQISLKLLKKFTPRAGTKRSALCEGTLNGLTQQMRLQDALMLDP